MLNMTADSTISTSDQTAKESVLELTTDIVASYVANNTISVGELPELIKLVHTTLSSLSYSGARHAPLTRKDPAVPIEESVQPDYIVCLEDGKHLQVLKRHLKTSFGITVEEYKKRWGLPVDYPTVAPNYSKRRSGIAKNTGLGYTPKRREKLSIVSNA